MNARSLFIAAALSGVGLSASALAVTNPFTEAFNSPAANWSSSSVILSPISYPSSGGPDGSSYGSMNLDLTNQGVNAQPIAFAAHGAFGSSGNAFVGDWLGAGVTSISVSLRQNGPGAATFFLRFAPSAGPGLVAVLPTPVPANTWTTISIPINASYGGYIFEAPPGVSTFTPTFTTMSKLQIGILVDASLANRPTPLTLDVDNVSIVPAPGSMALIGIAGLGLGSRRRRA